MLYAGTSLSFQSICSPSTFTIIEKSERLLNQQETINGSSETNTQSPFNFNIFLKSTLCPSKKYENEFLEWFIGFSEGNGSFSMDKKTNRVYFILAQKDKVTLNKIRTKLGFGSVKGYPKKNPTHFRLVVSSKKNLIRLFHIFNGNLVLNKTNQRFKKWIDCFNIYYKENFQISFAKNRTYLISLKNAWFSGFIDAEGCFSARIIDNSRIRLRFQIKQLDFCEAALQAIQKLSYSSFLNSSSYWGNLSQKKETISPDGVAEFLLTFTIDSHCNLLILINYLDKFCLQSKKKISFVKFKKLSNALLIGKTGFVRLQRLAKEINEYTKDL